MAQSELNVTNRDRTGKGVARTLRREGLIPATVYGRGLEPCSIIVEPKALKAAIATEAGWNTLLTLKGEGAFSGKVVILKDMQVDAIRRNMKHVDFQVIDLKKKIHVMVPVHTVGKPEGEKVGGIMQVIRHELEVKCLPTAIPSAIEVDVTAMKVGDVLHVEDLVLPAGIEVPHEVNFTLITLSSPTVEEEETEEAEGAEEV